MTGIANGAVVQVRYLAGERIAKCAEPPRGIERLIIDAVEGKIIQFLQGWNLHKLTFNDSLAGIAILVDKTVGRPG